MTRTSGRRNRKTGEDAVKGIGMVQKYSRIKSGTIVCLALAIATLSLAIPHAQAQTVTTLYDFATNSSMAQQPSGVIAQGRDGNFYGITQSPDRGAIYKVTPSGTFTLLHTMASDLSEGTF